MLQEALNPSQEQGKFRRIFSDKFFDLYVWYRRQGGPISGFQLCYDKGKDEHAITWEDGEYKHARIDDGESGIFIKSSPVLIRDGKFSKSKIMDKFIKAAKKIDPHIRDFVVGKLKTL